MGCMWRHLKSYKKKSLATEPRGVNNQNWFEFENLIREPKISRSKFKMVEWKLEIRNVEVKFQNIN